MSELSSDQIALQLRWHMRSLQSLGIDFVPGMEALPEEISETAPDPLATRRHELSLLSRVVADCSRCGELYSTRSQTVFGAGSVSPVVLFLGPAPTDVEDQSGLPLQGPAGELFDKMLGAMQFSREDVYITDVIKCRTPRQRPPTIEECGNCSDHLSQQLALLQPKYICCLGGLASQQFLLTDQPLQNLRNQVHEKDGRKVICTLHPQQLLVQPNLKRECWEDLKLLLKVMGRPVPA